MTMKMPHGLLHALLFDRNGGARSIDPIDIANRRPENRLLWPHFDVAENLPAGWMRTALGIWTSRASAATLIYLRYRNWQ